MAKDPAVLFYIDNWLTSTAEMDSDVRGWYLNLILHQYDKKTLPDDVEKLAVLAGVKFSEYERFKHVFEHVLKDKFKKCSEERLENSFAADILKKRESFKNKRSDAGKMSYFIKYIKANFKPKKAELEFIKSNVNLSELDLKDEHMLKHVFEHLLELYINGNGNINTNKEDTISWKDSFEIYLEELEKAFSEIITDSELISEQERLNPNIDVILSMEKAKVNFWCKEDGWNNKKKSKTKTIDWTKTFINAISISSNKVWKPKSNSYETNQRNNRPQKDYSATRAVKR